jgi:hypothetical protein
MKILVIGGGIYGCHLATHLKKNKYKVDLYEQNNTLLSEASGNNQFRLHQGFHYARNYITRQQSKKGFEIFLKYYFDCVVDVPENYYFVPTKNSLIDFGTYLSIFENEGFEFKKLEKSDFTELNDIEGGFKVSEKAINIPSLREYFGKMLSDVITFNKKVNVQDLEKLKKQYDLILDCTWNKLIQKNDFYYELTHIAYVECKSNTHPALTLVDGELWSLYPTWQKNLFTLSYVKFTPLIKGNDFKEINDYKKRLSKKELLKNYSKIFDHVTQYYPAFDQKFKLVGHQTSIKTKPYGSSEPRDCRIEKTDNVISIFSGKIDTFYVAENYLNEIL